VPSVTIGLISDDELREADHPELNVRLVVEGIMHDSTGRRPPERLEVRLSWRALGRLSMQIHAMQTAQCIQARARAAREAERQRIRRMAQAPAEGSGVGVATLQDRDPPPGGPAV
jgi:hypothetical protein